MAGDGLREMLADGRTEGGGEVRKESTVEPTLSSLFWIGARGNVQVRAALIRGGGLLVDLSGGGAITFLETGCVKGPSRAFSRDSGKGGAAPSQQDRVASKQ